MTRRWTGFPRLGCGNHFVELELDQPARTENELDASGMDTTEREIQFEHSLNLADTAGGWRPDQCETGCVIDVDSGQTIARGFAMPHSPRVHMGDIWLLDSGRGALVRLARREVLLEKSKIKVRRHRHIHLDSHRDY